MNLNYVIKKNNGLKIVKQHNLLIANIPEIKPILAGLIR